MWGKSYDRLALVPCLDFIESFIQNVRVLVWRGPKWTIEIVDNKTWVSIDDSKVRSFGRKVGRDHNVKVHLTDLSSDLNFQDGLQLKEAFLDVVLL
jgi:hypothetical protein